MAQVARASCAKKQPYRRQRDSQGDFKNRLLHLQRSEPVDAKDLTHRLESLIVEAQERKRRNAGDGRAAASNVNTQSRTPPDSTTRRKSWGTTRASNFGRSSIVTIDPSESDALPQLSRIASALQYCRDADPQRISSSGTTVSHDENHTRGASQLSAQEERVEATRAVARRSQAFSAPEVVTIETQSDATPLPPVPAVQNMQNSDGVQSMTHTSGSGTRRAPPPLVITRIPYSGKPEVVDVSSPMTSKPMSELPELKRISLFGESFHQNTDSFMAYEPECYRQSTLTTSSTGNRSSNFASPHSPLTNYSSNRRTIDTLDSSSSEKKNTWHSQAVSSNDDHQREASFPGGSSSLDSICHETSKERRFQPDPTGPKSTPSAGRLYQSRSMDFGSIHVAEANTDYSDRAQQSSDLRLRSVPVVEENGDYEGDATSGCDSTIFDVSAARSSATSVEPQSATSSSALRRQPSKRAGFTPDQFVEIGYGAAISRPVTQSLAEPLSSPVSPLMQMQDEFCDPLDRKQSVSPLVLSTLLMAGEKVSPLATTQHQPGRQAGHAICSTNTISPVSRVDHFTVSRKPVNSAIFEDQDGLLASIHSRGKVIEPSSPGRSSTALGNVGDFMDGASVVPAKGHDNGMASTWSADVRGPLQSTPLPSFHTDAPKGKLDIIADGIAFIDFDSPVTERPPSRTYVAQHSTQDLESARRPDTKAAESWRSLGKQESLNGHLHESTPQDPDALASSTNAHVEMNLHALQSTPCIQSPARESHGADSIVSLPSSRPDYRARPLISESVSAPPRPRTAATRSQGPTPPTSATPTKIPNKIRFPPRANNSEIATMSPESLKLLHEQEALLRKRYEAILRPIDSALKQGVTTPLRPLHVEERPISTISVQSHGSRHSCSKSLEAFRGHDIRIATNVTQIPSADLAFMREKDLCEEDIRARELAAIRSQRRNVGPAAARNYVGSGFGDPVGNGAPDGEYVTYGTGMDGEPIGLPTAFHSPGLDITKSSFIFDDDTPDRRRKGKWKFWKAR